MKAKQPTFVIGLTVALVCLTNAQTGDKEADEAIRKASEAGKKMGVNMPDVQKLMEEDAKEEAKEKQKLQAVVDAPGPATFPAWMPKVPEFTPSGPAKKKLIDDKPCVVQTGTSTLTPEALGDAWEKFKDDRLTLGHMRSNINDTITHTVTFRTMEEPIEEVKMEAERKPREKVTRVTISSLLPVPKGAGDD